MPLPESSAAPAAPAPKAERHSPGISESGDLSASVDFFSEPGSPSKMSAVDDNDPNGGGDEGTGELGDLYEEGHDDGEGSEEKESGEVGEEEAEDGEGLDESSDEEGGDPLDEGESETPKDEKTTRVTIGDKDYDVPLDATIPVKVNGEIQQASIQDMMNAYSSKANIAKELQSVSAAKDELTEHRRQVVRDIEKKEVALADANFTQNRGRQALAQGDFESALNDFFEFNPDHWDKFDEVMTGYYSKFATLPPEQRRVIQLERKTALLGMKQARQAEIDEVRKGVESFNAMRESSVKAVGLTESDVENAWDKIVEKANKGEFTPQQIEWLKKATPEQRWQTSLGEAVTAKTRGKISEVLKKQFPKLEKRSAEIITALESKLSGKYLIESSKEDIAGIISREYNVSQAGKPAKKGATTNSLRDKAQPRHTLREAASQEADEDDLYDQTGRSGSGDQVWGGQFSNRPY